MNVARGVFAAGVVASSKAAAEEASQQYREAKIQTCRPRRGSLLQFGIPLVDATLLDVPENGSNWNEENLVSEVRPLRQGYLWIRRWYDGASGEGRRASVLYFAADPKSARELSANCLDAEFAAAPGKLALACASEKAGENVLHRTHVFDLASGRVLTEQDRCREPYLTGPARFACRSESLGTDGRLKLSPKQLPFE